MIKFFRKIRQKMLVENKFSRYMLYAIGEILLVVIGILIALWISNKNQKLIKQVKIESILVKIQNDLLQDIDNAEYLVNSYIRIDSIADRIIGGNLSYEEVKEIPTFGFTGLSFITLHTQDYNIQSNGYDLLMSILDDLPKEYDELLKTLNYNFSSRQKSFNTLSKNSEAIVNQYKYYLANNHSWLAIDDYNGYISDAQNEYIRNNPRFKNQINLLYNSRIQIIWQYIRYRENIMKTYIIINNLLGEKAKVLPEEIRATSVAKESDAEKLVGTYKLNAGPNNTVMGDQLEVIREGKNLYFKIEKGKSPPFLFMDIEKLWFSIPGMTYIYRFEYSGKNTLSIVTPRQDQTHWVRVTEE